MNNTMAKDLNKLFLSRGYNPVIGTIYQQQEYWLRWYRGEVDGFHNTQMKNAEGILIEVIKPSLQMAKKVSEDITSLLYNENVQLIVGNPKAQEVLDKVLLDNNFTDEMTNFVELTCVFGTGAMVQYIVDGETKINYLFGDRVVVIDYDNSSIKAIAAIQQFQKNDHKYNHIMYHTFKDKKYRITHEMFRTKAGRGLGNETSLGILFSDEELEKMRHVTVEDNVEIVEYYIEYDSEPHFQTFKLGIANNWDVKSPMGISLYANSTGTLLSIDEKYYSSRMDSVNSRKRLFIDDAASKVQKFKDENGNLQYRKYFDPSETQFQVLKGMNDGDSGKAIEVFAPVYDSAQHDNAIQAELNYLAFKCMLGTNYYSFKDGVVGYQNELGLTLSNAPLRRDRNKNLNRLKPAIIGMMKAILFLEKENGNYSGNLDIDYEVNFDDDIFTDDASKLEKLRLDAQDGFVPDYKYVMEAYSLSEEEAKKLLEEAEGFTENVEPIVKPLNDDVAQVEDTVDAEE